MYSVAVIAYHDFDGAIKPLWIIARNEYTDVDTRYKIQRASNPVRAASLKAGGMGLLYYVRVEDKEYKLFYELGRAPEHWFMEEPIIENTTPEI